MRFLTSVFLCCLCLLLGHSPHAHAESRRILIYGDSNVWGWQAVEAGFPVTRLADAKRWAGVLQKQLGARYTVVVDGLGARTVDVGYARGVATLQGAEYSGENLLRFALAREAPLELVVVMLGTNDLQDELNRDTAQIAEGIGKLVKIVRADYADVFTRYPQPRVLVVVPPPIGDTGRTPFKDAFSGAARLKSEQLAPVVKEAAQRDGYALFDAGQILPRAGGIDGIHLTVEQHARLGRALAPVVRRLMER